MIILAKLDNYHDHIRESVEELEPNQEPESDTQDVLTYLEKDLMKWGLDTISSLNHIS